MTTTGTWYPPPGLTEQQYDPAAGTGGFLINLPFATMNNHPITPPPELIRQWDSEASMAEMPWQTYIATQAASWGADQEREAIIHWLITGPCWVSIAAIAPHLIFNLRKHRRPKPPSLKEQALQALKALPTPSGQVRAESFDLIRRALEALPETDLTPLNPAAGAVPDTRYPECVAEWPECYDGGYDPRCCRFPKSCSCEIVDLPHPMAGEMP